MLIQHGLSINWPKGQRKEPPLILAIKRINRGSKISKMGLFANLENLAFNFLGVIPEKILKRLFSIVLAEVEGNSMSPTVGDKERVAIQMRKRALSEEDLQQLNGKVVLIERHELPGIYLIKRIKKIDGELIWIEGDNDALELKELQNDSRKFGWMNKNVIIGKVL
jgi:signal peptidase I